MKRLKFARILLVLTLAIGLFVGCSNETQTTETVHTPATEVQTENATEEVTEPITEEVTEPKTEDDKDDDGTEDDSTPEEETECDC